LGGNAADILQALHFASPLKAVDFEPIPYMEIERLIECERAGDIYKPKQLQVENALLTRLADLQLSKKAIEDEEAELKAQLLEAMKAQGIDKHETDVLQITYIAPTKRETFDSKKLKAEMPEIAAKYTKESNVKDSVRITLKR
jgi:predicted phage-related endonuclease